MNTQPTNYIDMITDSQKESTIAIPIGKYNKPHLYYVTKNITKIWSQLDQIRKLKKTYQPKSKCGEFLAQYKPIT